MPMSDFNTRRREMLKFGGLGLSALALPSIESLADAPKPSIHTPIDSVFNVRAFGATGDGKTVDTPAINRAIEAAASAGGGTVLFPTGTYTCFSIRLKSYVHLYLSQGATILAAASPLPGQTTGYKGGTYDPAEPKTTYDAFQDFGHNHWHNSLLWGENIHDLSITGPGLIYGKGLSFGAGPGRFGGPGTGVGFGPDRQPIPGAPVPPSPQQRPPRGDYPMYQAEQPGVGNKSIALKNCRNVILRDFSILKGGHFGLLLTGVDNLTIDNLKIDTDRDGMDIDCCKNVHISNCTVNSPWDDGICPKSSFALGYNRATENVTITNCYVTGTYLLGTVLDGTYKKFPEDARGVGRTGRIKCGTESNGGFKNITISNCVFEGCDGLALESEDGALCEDITVTNITMRDIHSSPLFIRLGARLRGPKGTGDQSTVVGSMRRILLSNITSFNGGSRLCSILSGIPDYLIQDIKIANYFSEHQGGVPDSQAKVVPPENVDRYPDPGMFGPMPAQGFFLRHIKNLEMSHIEIAPMKPDPRPSFQTFDVHRVDFIAATAPTQPSAFLFRQSSDIRILLSRAAKDLQLDSADEKSV